MGARANHARTDQQQGSANERLALSVFRAQTQAHKETCQAEPAHLSWVLFFLYPGQQNHQRGDGIIGYGQLRITADEQPGKQVVAHTERQP